MTATIVPLYTAFICTSSLVHGWYQPISRRYAVVRIPHRKLVPRAMAVTSATLMVLSAFKSNDGESRDGLAASYIPLDDLLDQPITCDPDFGCVLDDEYGVAYRMESPLVVGLPVVAPVVAFLSFDSCAKAYRALTEFLSSNKWVAVDGGAYQAKMITPAINGLVVPAIALLFATLTSTTITTLRQRQVDVRRAINMEAGELRAIECLLDSVPPGFVQDQCRDYLIQYTSRILAECHPRLGSGNDVINPRRGFDSELNGFSQQLNQAYASIIPAHVADECYASVARLREQRVNRITALQSIYPPLHYAILVILAVAECVAFLIETDQELLVFLNAVQLKLLWSMLVGTFVACFAVFIDLRAPFSGSYQISASVDQLQTIKLTLQASRLMSAQQRVQSEIRQKAELDELKVNGIKQQQEQRNKEEREQIAKKLQDKKLNADTLSGAQKIQDDNRIKAELSDDRRVITLQGRSTLRNNSVVNGARRTEFEINDMKETK